MPKPRKLTLSQAHKTGKGHPEWEAMSTAERKIYVAKVNEAIKRDAEAKAYFDSFKPRVGRKG